VDERDGHRALADGAGHTLDGPPPTSPARKTPGTLDSSTYMDRGALVEVDVHEGLETTLTVLGRKLRHAGVTSCANSTARCRG
jgi:hypothetical protein